MAKVKTTLSIDEDLLRGVRVAAARTRKTQSEIVEDALRSADPFQAIRSKTQLGEEEAHQLAGETLHEMRSQSRMRAADQSKNRVPR